MNVKLPEGTPGCPDDAPVPGTRPVVSACAATSPLRRDR